MVILLEDGKEYEASFDGNEVGLVLTAESVRQLISENDSALYIADKLEKVGYEGLWVGDGYLSGLYFKKGYSQFLRVETVGNILLIHNKFIDYKRLLSPSTKEEAHSEAIQVIKDNILSIEEIAIKDIIE